jgi:hypothetical protein
VSEDDETTFDYYYSLQFAPEDVLKLSTMYCEAQPSLNAKGGTAKPSDAMPKAGTRQN